MELLSKAYYQPFSLMNFLGPKSRSIAVLALLGQNKTFDTNKPYIWDKKAGLKRGILENQEAGAIQGECSKLFGHITHD